MKSLAIVLLLAVTASGRLIYKDVGWCPDGYFFAGEDPEETALKGWLDEIGHSPTWSCYKGIPVDGINDGLHKCEEDKGRIVVFEDVQEVQRVFEQTEMANLSEPILTSAMYFEDLKKWIYLGTNHTNFDLVQIFGEINKGNVEQQCLTVTKTKIDSGDFVFEWNAVKCNDNQMALCEMRVEITYYVWFYSNWLTILLMILLLILLISLCVSALSYTQHRQRIYRGRTQAQQGVNANNARPYPYNDEPPKYNDVTQTNRNMEEGKFDRYKNKGKELLAKVYLVK